MTYPTVELTDAIRQDKAGEGPPAFLVFCHARDQQMHEYKVFAHEREARDYADECESIDGPDDWPIYPLWAGHDIRELSACSPNTKVTR